MANTFHPPPVGAVAVSAVLLGIGNTVLVAVAAASASILVPHAHADAGQIITFALTTGLVSSALIALLERPHTYRQRTMSPYGIPIALYHLASPLLVGAVAGWLICGRRWFFVGTAAALLAYLVQFFLLTPWKKTVNDDDMKGRSREFAKVTHRYVEEYKDDLRDLSQQKAQRKHDAMQKKLKKQRETK